SRLGADPTSSRMASMTIPLATSPAAWPPMPSATRKTSPSASAASSLCGRTRPTSVASPDRTVGPGSWFVCGIALISSFLRADTVYHHVGTSMGPGGHLGLRTRPWRSSLPPRRRSAWGVPEQQHTDDGAAEAQEDEERTCDQDGRRHEADRTAEGPRLAHGHRRRVGQARALHAGPVVGKGDLDERVPGPPLDGDLLAGGEEQVVDPQGVASGLSGEPAPRVG